MSRLRTPLDASPFMTPPTARVPRLALTILALVVAGVHAWLLQALPDSLGLDGAGVTAAPAAAIFNTRRIETGPSSAGTTSPSPRQPTAHQRSKAATASAAFTGPQASITAPLAPPQPAEPATQVAHAEALNEVAPPPPAKRDPAADHTAAQATPSAVHHVHALTVPGSVRLNYDIAGQARGIQYTAQGTLTWAQTAGRYDAKLLVSVFLLGSRSLTSTGAVTADGLVPQRFSDKARSELAAHFLPDQGRISFSANSPDAVWQRGAQDRLSMFLQLASLLAAEPAKATAGTKVPMYVVGPRDAEEWVFSVGPPETLALPMGPTPSVYLLRLPRRDYDQKVEIWLAPQLGYLPVRIKQTQHNGDVVDQTLASSTPLP